MLKALGVLKKVPIEPMKLHLDATDDISSVMTVLEIFTGGAIDMPERSKAHIFEVPIASNMLQLVGVL